MAHKVTCKYCNLEFDRDKENYVSVGSRRYAHVDCYKQEQLKDPTLKDLEIIFPDEFVTCKYCKKKINKTKDTDYKAVKNKFAHLDVVVCAYNAGEGEVLSWLDSDGKLKTIKFEETKTYLNKVKTALKVYREKLNKI